LYDGSIGEKQAVAAKRVHRQPRDILIYLVDSVVDLDATAYHQAFQLH
jgi:hypothetical protein